MDRLVEKLNIYNIDLGYKKGCGNAGADYHSRHASKGIFAISQADRVEELRTHQRTDILISGIRKFLDFNRLPTNDKKLQQLITNLAPRSFVKNDILWFVLPRQNKEKAVFFTPRSMVNTIISNSYGKSLTRHWSIERITERIITS
jgi:hypothetical protein